MLRNREANLAHFAIAPLHPEHDLSRSELLAQGLSGAGGLDRPTIHREDLVAGTKTIVAELLLRYQLIQVPVARRLLSVVRPAFPPYRADLLPISIPRLPRHTNSGPRCWKMWPMSWDRTGSKD